MVLDSLNRQQQRELKFYFEYPDELEGKCIELAKDFKSGREDYKQIKKLVRKCCNKLDSICLLYTSPSPRDRQKSRMPSSA